MDPLLLATYNRAKETMAIADSADKRIQEEVRAMENLDGIGKYLAKYGGKMKREMYGYGGKMKYNNGGGIEDPQLKELYSSLYGLSFPSYPKTLNGTSVTQIKPLSTNQIQPIDLGINVPESMVYNQEIDPKLDFSKLQGTTDVKPAYMDLSGLKGTTDVRPVNELGDVSDELLQDDNLLKSETSPTKEEAMVDYMTKRAMQGYDFTMGDYLGLSGVGIGGLGPLSTTIANRLTDRPNINFYRDFGQDTLAKLEGQKGFLGQQFKQQEAQIGEFARNATRRYQNTARSVNQARAMGQMSDMQANDMLQKAYANYAQQMLGVESQIAQTTLQAEKAFAAGETARDLADRQDRDAFFTNLNKDLVNLGTAMQAGAKALNVKELDQQINKIMPMLSSFGISIRKDGKGGYEFYSTATNQTQTTEQVKANLDKAKQEAAEKAEKEKEPTTVDEKKKVTSTKDDDVTKVDNSFLGGKKPVNPILKTNVGDGNDYIRNRLNFENQGGSFEGVGVDNYGFTGGGGSAKGTAMRTYFDASPGNTKGEKAVNAVNNYVIGTNPEINLKGGNTSIITDLNYTRKQFDALPEHIKEEMVDWKLNTGRGTTDLLLNALDPKIWSGVDAAAKTSPKYEDVRKAYSNKGKSFKKLTKEDLRKARMRLYKGRIKYLKDKYGEKDNRYLAAKKGFENSQQYR